ncbi:hypothetical protein EYF80_039039 [Liparis tanakae]|uniref:Uncharacterized protein n=1 Tax=Liparis tanakae TaxID=230148 RepID=A0A4Z2GDH6_9TELE|nr:hypothetical protein EYF80_039039 [Liparis tanakae]
MGEDVAGIVPPAEGEARGRVICSREARRGGAKSQRKDARMLGCEGEATRKNVTPPPLRPTNPFGGEPGNHGSPVDPKIHHEADESLKVPVKRTFTRRQKFSSLREDLEEVKEEESAIVCGLETSGPSGDVVAPQRYTYAVVNRLEA